MRHRALGMLSQGLVAAFQAVLDPALPVLDPDPLLLG